MTTITVKESDKSLTLTKADFTKYGLDFSKFESIGFTNKNLHYTWDEEAVTIRIDNSAAALKYIGYFEISNASNPVTFNVINDLGKTSGNNIYGTDFANTLKGTTANNAIYGYAGNDKLYGYDGNDTLRGGSGNDYASGGNGNDKLYGDSGNDDLRGDAGNDRIEGGSGNDLLIGGMGKDDLVGGSGADRFDFNSVAESTVASTGRDTIRDFSHKQGDKIDLSTIDANTGMSGNQAFQFIGKNAFSSHAGELNYKVYTSGIVISGDVNGDGKADFSIFAQHLTSIGASDFLL